MDIIEQLEIYKYVLLDELYTIFPSHTFSPSIHSRTWPLSKYRDASTKMKRLEDLVTSANTQWWDGFFLKQYFKSRISPRGLRILKGCAFLDEDLRTEWEGVAEFCTQKWIQVLITHRDRRYLALRQKAEKLVIDLLSLHPQLPTAWLKTFKINTKKSENSLIENKLGKLRRDLDDYSYNRVFNWKSKHIQPPPLLPPPRPIPPLISEHTSSSPSLLDPIPFNPAPTSPPLASPHPVMVDHSPPALPAVDHTNQVSLHDPEFRPHLPSDSPSVSVLLAQTCAAHVPTDLNSSATNLVCPLSTTKPNLIKDIRVSEHSSPDKLTSPFLVQTPSSSLTPFQSKRKNVEEADEGDIVIPELSRPLKVRKL